MAEFILHNLDDDIRDMLRARAEEHGHTVDEEVREILRNAVLSAPTNGRPRQLGTEIAARFRHCALDEPIPELRGQTARPADFDE